MTPVIPPSIGRRVLVFSSAIRSVPDGATINDQSTPFDGGIAYVHSESMLNVSFTDHNGRAFSQTSVKLLDRALEPVDAHGREWYAVWMPYQFEQALRAREPKAAPSGRPADVVLKKTHDNGVPVDSAPVQASTFERAVQIMDQAEAEARSA